MHPPRPPNSPSRVRARARRRVAVGCLTLIAALVGLYLWRVSVDDHRPAPALDRRTLAPAPPKPPPTLGRRAFYTALAAQFANAAAEGS